MRIRSFATAAALFSLALGLRLLYLEQARSDPTYGVLPSIFDSLFYHRQALGIAGIDPSVDPTRDLPYFLNPLYSYFVALLYALGRPDPELVKLAQAVLGAASSVLVWAIGRELFSESAAIVAGALIATCGILIYYTQILLPETLVLFVNLAFLLVLVRGWGRLRPAHSLVAGLLIGVATAAKTNALLLLPATLAAFWIAPAGLAGRVRWQCAGALALGALLAIAPFTLRNWIVSGEVVLMNTTGGRNLWKGNGPGANGTHVTLEPGLERGNLGDYLEGRMDARTAVERDRFFARRTLEHVSAHPAQVLGLLGWKFALLFNAVDLGIRDRFYFAQRYSTLLQLPLPSFGLVAPIGLAGMLFAWRRRPRIAPLYALFAVQVVSFVLVFVLARYRLVLLSCLVLFAAWQLLDWLDSLRARRRNALAASGLACALFAGFVHLPLAGITREREFARAYLDLGDLHASRRMHREAVEDFEQALRSDWGETSAALGRFLVKTKLVRAHLALGERERARELIGELERGIDELDANRAGARAVVDALRRSVEFRGGDAPPAESPLPLPPE